jgi:hypothetical protein
MKTYLSYSFILAAAACSLATGQTAYTTPVGYNSMPLKAGFNSLGLTLQTATLVAGNFETVAGTVLTDTGTTFSTISGRTYVLEITSGVLTGVIQEVLATSISGSSITTPSNLQTLGLTTADTYKLRLAPTLEEIFTTTALSAGGVLQSGLNSIGADVVWIPTGTGTYDQYFLHSSGTFRKAGTATLTPNIPVVYSDGFLIQKKGAAAATLTVAGELKKTGTNSVIVPGYNLLSIVAPVGLNLFNVGLEDDITTGLNVTGADLVWVQKADLTYKKYFRHTTGNWRDADSPTVNLTQTQVEAITLPTGILIQHKANTTINVDLNVPAMFSGL